LLLQPVITPSAPMPSALAAAYFKKPRRFMSFAIFLSPCSVCVLAGLVSALRYYSKLFLVLIMLLLYY
jgi:hypothetical protein